MKARTEGEPAAKPLGDLRLLPSRDVFHFCTIRSKIAHFNLLSAFGLLLPCLLAPQGNLHPSS